MTEINVLHWKVGNVLTMRASVVELSQDRTEVAKAQLWSTVDLSLEAYRTSCTSFSSADARLLRPLRHAALEHVVRASQREELAPEAQRLDLLLRIAAKALHREQHLGRLSGWEGLTTARELRQRRLWPLWLKKCVLRRRARVFKAVHRDGIATCMGHV